MSTPAEATPAPTEGLKPPSTNLDAMIKAYGILWRDVPSTAKAIQARMVLKERLTHAERKQGIRMALDQFGDPTVHDILTLDHPSTRPLEDDLVTALKDLICAAVSMPISHDNLCQGALDTEVISAEALLERIEGDR